MINCIMCGKTIKDPTPRQKACSECSTDYHRECARQYRIVHPITPEKNKEYQKKSKMKQEIKLTKAQIEKQRKRQEKKEQNAKDKAWRAFCVNRDNNECVICKRKGRLNVHHLLPKEKYPQYRHQVWNGISLCVYHHRWGKNAPHHDSIGFVAWLLNNRKGLVEFIIKILDGETNRWIAKK